MVLCFAEFELDVEELELRRSGELVHADATVLRLLTCLAGRAGRLVSKDELADEVWDGRAIADNAISVAMARLRKLLGQTRDGREYVVTAYGRGYRFIHEVAARSSTRRTPLIPSPVQVSHLPPFVGRGFALEQLRAALQRSLNGRGRCCVVVGEPGSGKTHTVERFEREVEQAGSQVQLAWGYCREAGDTPMLWPWRRLMEAVVVHYGAERLQAELGQGGRELFAFLQLRAAGEGPLPQHSLYGVYDAVVRTLKLASRRQAWVLVIDDLHRADAATLELLSCVLDELAELRLLVICSLRRTLGRRPQRPGTLLPHVLTHRNAERIALSNLTPAEVSSYVTAQVQDADGRLSRAVFDKSEGNPFFMSELMRAYRDGGQSEPDLSSLPSASLELVQQRMIRLDADARGVLSIAAVIGRSFELPLLSKLTGREPGLLMASLDQALEDEVVVASAESSTGFAFAHALLWTVLYQALGTRERRQLHAKVAAWLEERRLAAELVAPSELAFHYHSALPDCDLRRAIDACRAAASAAYLAVGRSDVIRYTRHALEALDLLESPSVKLRTQLWFVISIVEREHPFPGGGLAIHGTVRLARQQRDGGTLARTGALFNLHPGLKPVPDASSVFEEALALLGPDELGPRSVALGGLAVAAPHCFSAARSRKLIDEALPMARKSGSRPAHYTVLIYALYLDGGPGLEDETEAHLREFDALNVDHPRITVAMRVDVALQRAIAAARSGDQNAAIAVMKRATERSHELRHSQLTWHCERLTALLQLGRICAPAQPEHQEALAKLQQLHQQFDDDLFGAETFAAFDRAVTFAELGQPVVVDDALRVPLRYEASDPPSIWALKVRALVGAGLHDEARALLARVPTHKLADLPRDRDYLGSLGHLAASVARMRVVEYAQPLYALLAPHASRYAIGISGLNEGSVEQLLGQLAAVMGRDASACTHLELAVRANRAAGLGFRTLAAQLELARCMRSQDAAKAIVLARDVEREARQIQLRGVADAAGALLH